MGMTSKNRYFNDVETRKEAKERLSSQRKIRDERNELKEEIYFKTGKEFSYKMHSVINSNNNLIKIDKSTDEMKKQRKVQLNFEIIRIEKKLKKMTPKTKSKIIKFLKNGKTEILQSKQELKSNTKKLLIYNNYLDQLKK